MRRIPTLTVLVAAAFPAMAAGWSSYENTFPALPCQDGWAACIVGGAAAGPGALKDSAGRPLPADARFGFFDLQATANLSPFASLSAYSGPVGGAVAEAPPPEPPSRPQPVADTRPSEDAVADASPPPSSGNNGGSSTSGTGMRPPETTPTPVASNNPPAVGGGMRPGAPSAQPTSTTPTTTSTPPTVGGGMRPGGPSSQPTSSTPSSGGTAPTAMAPPTTSNPSTQPTNAVVAPVVGAPADNSCDDLVKLEPAAMMGQLAVGQSKCLEGRVGSEPQQTTKDKVSRLLITNAEAKGDKSEWERLMKRHLEDIDRSDPDLCFKYALHLSRGGVGRAQGVIRWADYSLENKSKWSGTTYKTRVFNLYKLRAEAANKLWQDAEKEFAEGERTDEKEAKAAKFRGQAKDYAREWLDYAKASEQDTKTAMALCVSASGNRAFCEGG